jgi:hypothetical protein
VQYEPGLPSSGMTMFGENGFLIGREAFSSAAETELPHKLGYFFHFFVIKARNKKQLVDYSWVMNFQF